MMMNERSLKTRFRLRSLDFVDDISGDSMWSLYIHFFFSVDDGIQTLAFALMPNPISQLHLNTKL
jgi:hypothetical protein